GGAGRARGCAGRPRRRGPARGPRSDRSRGCPDWPLPTVYGAGSVRDAARPCCHRFFMPRPPAGHDTPVSTRMTRRTLLPAALVVTATMSAGAWYARREDAGAVLTTAAVTRGSLVSVVSATGTLQPVTTVH